MNFDSLKFYRVYLASLSVSGWIFGQLDTKGLIQIYKGKERKISPLFVHVLLQTWCWDVSRCSHAVDVKEVYEEVWCTRRVVGCFPFFFFTKNVRKCDENVHRVKKVITIYLTQVPFVPSLGQIQHGGELLWKVINGTHISPGKIPTGKTGLPFQIFTIHREFSEERLKNVCVCSIYTQPEFLGKRDGPVIVIEPVFIF